MRYSIVYMLQMRKYIASDIRLKTNIRKYDVRFENMYMELEPVIYEMKDEIGIGHAD